MFESFLIDYCERGIFKVCFLQNRGENEEDLLSYPKVVIKRKIKLKKKFTAYHGSFTQDFYKEFSEHDVFHKVHRS